MWLDGALRQARLFNRCDIVLIAEAGAIGTARPDPSLNVTCVPVEEIGLSPKHEEFRRSSPLDRSFRDGFWTFTSERFFVLESAMRQLRLEYRRMLGNGWCTRPKELDCQFESICEGCGFFQTDIEFLPTLQRQRDHAAAHDQPDRHQLFQQLIDQVEEAAG